MQVTGSDYAVGAATLAAWCIPIARVARLRHRQRKDQMVYERGMKEVPGMFERIPTGAERTALLERQVGQMSGEMKSVRIDVTTLLRGHEEIKARLDKMSTGNGGDTYELPDVLQRVAKALNVWDPPSPSAKTRHKQE